MSKQLNSVAALTVAVSVPLIAETPNSTASATKTKKVDTTELVKEEKIFATPPPVSWPHETGGIPATGRATFGTLENGIKNAKRERFVSFYNATTLLTK